MQAGVEVSNNGGNFWAGFGKSLGISGASMVLGAGMGLLANVFNIAGIIPGALWGAGSGYLTGGITSVIGGGEWSGGAVWGAITGGVFGAYSGYKVAANYGWNKITGGLTQTQKDILYNLKAGNLTESEALSLLHGNVYDKSGSPDVKIIHFSEKDAIDQRTGEIIGKATIRGKTLGIDSQGNEIDIFRASHIKGGVNSKIYLNDNLGGKQFIKTSFHELVHARQFYNGEFYSKRLNLSNFQEDKIRFGLVLYSESWAYGNTALRYGNFSNYNSKIRYWHQWYNNDYSWFKYLNQ